MSNNSDQFEYDVALSFAGEDRETAKRFADLLQSKTIKVFYDEQEVADLWGKDLVAHLADIYGKKARYCVMFISKYYPLKKWTNLERKYAQERAFRDANEYILPIRLDDTEVPGITETTGYRDLRQHPVESIVDTLEQKIAKAKGQPAKSSASKAKDIQTINGESTYLPFGNIPIPKRKKTFTQLEKDRFARESFNYIKEYFRQGLKQLETADSDIQTDIEDITNLHFVSKIYLRGDIKVQCSIWLGDNFGPNSICYNEGMRRIDTNSINESIAVEDNGEELRLHVGLFGMHEDRMATQQQAAEHLWKRFTAPLSYK